MNQGLRRDRWTNGVAACVGSALIASVLLAFVPNAPAGPALTAASTATTSLEVLHEREASYVEDEDGRPIARMTARLVRSSQGIHIEYSASAFGPGVEPPPGFEGVPGSNVTTAREIDGLLARRAISLRVEDLDRALRFEITPAGGEAHPVPQHQRSHSFDDAASRLLTTHPGAVLAWAKRYPEGITKAGQLVLDQIKAKRPTVRQRGMLSFASLPQPLRPISTLYYAANDEREPIGVREAAVRVAGSTGHPALRAWLLDIAYEPAHPLWIAALSELHAMGEGFLLTDRDFAAIAPRDADHVGVLRKKMKNLRTKWQQMQQKDHLASRLPALFLQAAWMKVIGHARAKHYGDWLVRVGRHARNVPGNHKVLMKLSRDPKITTPLAFAPGAARIPTFDALVNEIRALAGQALQSEERDVRDK